MACLHRDSYSKKDRLLGRSCKIQMSGHVPSDAAALGDTWQKP